MSLRHPKAVAWERKLSEVFDTIDAEMETAYGDRYPLHPARATRGKTANHVVTTASCDTCHRTTAWIPATFSMPSRFGGVPLPTMQSESSF